MSPELGELEPKDRTINEERLNSGATILSVLAIIFVALSIPATWYSIQGSLAGGCDVSFSTGHMNGVVGVLHTTVRYSHADGEGYGYSVGVLMDQEVILIGAWLAIGWLFVAFCVLDLRLTSIVFSWILVVIALYAVLNFVIHITTAINSSPLPTYVQVPHIDGFSGSTPEQHVGTLSYGPSEGFYAVVLSCCLQILAAVAITVSRLPTVVKEEFGRSKEEESLLEGQI